MFHYGVTAQEHRISGDRAEYTYIAPLPVAVNMGSIEHEIDALLSRGWVPLVSSQSAGPLPGRVIRPRSLASLLAIKSVAITLSSTIPANPEAILEARDRLRDHLPPFRSLMFKLSEQLRNRVSEGMAIEEVNRECEENVDIKMRPALIDLEQKLRKERRNWAYKIVAQAPRLMKLFIGAPHLTTLDMVSLSVEAVTGVAIELAKANAGSSEAGLTFLLEIEKALDQ